jgi:hypothetical protein
MVNAVPSSLSPALKLKRGWTNLPGGIAFGHEGPPGPPKVLDTCIPLCRFEAVGAKAQALTVGRMRISR